MPTQQWLKPTEPRLRSPRIRTQAAKPPTKADDGGTPASAVEIRRSPQPTTQPLADPPRPVSQPAPRATPASGQKPEPCSRGISRLTQALGKGASPAGKPGPHVRGPGARGRGVLTRGKAGSRDLLIAGVTAQTGPWVLGVRACSARVWRLKAAVWPSVPVRVALPVTTLWVSARGGAGPVGLEGLRRREVELGVSRGSPRWAEGGGLSVPTAWPRSGALTRVAAG